MTTAETWTDYRKIAKDLLDHWLTQLDEVKIVVGTDMQMFSGTYAWAQHCHHVGLHFIQATDDSLWWEASGSLDRLCHELAVKSQWLSQVDSALDSEAWKHEEQRQKSFKTYMRAMDSLGLTPHPTVNQKSIDSHKVDQPERVYGDFYQICQSFQHSDYLYMIYQILCNYSHANLDIANSYVKTTMEGTQVESYSPTPGETGEGMKLMFMHTLAQSLVWAQSAVLNHLFEPHAEMDRLTSQAARIGCPAPLPLRPTKLPK